MQLCLNNRKSCERRVHREQDHGKQKGTREVVYRTQSNGTRDDVEKLNIEIQVIEMSNINQGTKRSGPSLKCFRYEEVLEYSNLNTWKCAKKSEKYT